MRTNTSTLIKDFKGYIYSYKMTAPPGCQPGYNPDANSTIPNNPGPRIFTVGAPFHFYFGLKKGKTAFDRFTVKWIKTDVITD
jgi:hypothetical protein